MKSKVLFVVLLVVLLLAGCSQECQHESSSWVLDKVATCENEGLKLQICNTCKTILQEEVVNKLDHDIVHHNGKESTCVTSGYKPYDTCNRCDYTTYEKLDKLDHDIVHHEGKESTCVTSGYKPYDTCNNCDYTTYEKLDKLDHDIVHHKGKEATCVTSGYKPYDTCNRCDYTTYEEIEMLNHDIVHHEGKEATTTEVGYKPYDTCNRCDYTTYEEIPIVKHNYLNYVCTICYESSPDNLKYELTEDESGYIVVGLHNPHNTIKKIVIPNEYNGKPVVGIYDWAFGGCNNLNYLEIPNEITYIGYGVNSNNLFYNEYDNGYYLGNKDNPYIVLVKARNELIESIKLYDSTKIIYGSAFYNCTSLTSITIPDSVTTIGRAAFSGCTSLTSITIPDSVTTIGNSTFSVCTSLTSITIPDSVTTIGNSAFSDCTSLTSITIPDSVTTIGNSAFEDCTSINKMTLPFIGGSADNNRFLGYIFGASEYTYNASYVPNSLTEVVITGGTTIGDGAFNDCTSLTSVTIPDSVTTIGEYAFYNCTSLINLYYNGTVTDWCRMRFKHYASNPMYYAKKLYVLNENNEYVEPTEVVVPDDVTTIGGWAFRGCTSLTSITIPDSVTTIGGWAFEYCTSLTSITIPDSVTEIGDVAFSSCTSLTSITIPNSVTTIGEMKIA